MTAHREPAYADSAVTLPVSEQASDTSLVLPLFTQMTEAEVEECAAAVLDGVARVGSGR